MSLLQKFFIALFPKRWAEAMEADSRAWMVSCSCGFARSIWELGGIRWKSSGKAYTATYMRCPRCEKRSWHKVTRDPKE